MQPALTSLLALAATGAAAILPRQTSYWAIEDFTVASTNCGPTYYQLKISGEGEAGVECYTSNSVASPTCPDANGPSPFNLTSCGNSPFSWQFSETRSPIAGNPPVYFIKFAYTRDGVEPIYGCSGLFDANKTTCETGGETLIVPGAFNVSTSSMSECIYA